MVSDGPVSPKVEVHTVAAGAQVCRQLVCTRLVALILNRERVRVRHRRGVGTVIPDGIESPHETLTTPKRLLLGML